MYTNGTKKLHSTKLYIFFYDRVFNFLLVKTSWNIDFYAIDQSWETCTDFDTPYEYTSCICPSFVYHSRLKICDCLRFTKVCFAPTHQKNSFVWMTLIPVLCHVSTKISVFVLLVCSKLDWHRTLSLYILVVIATRYCHYGLWRRFRH